MARATLLATVETADRRAMVSILFCVGYSCVYSCRVVVCLPRNPVVEQFRCLKNRAIEIQGAWRACNFTAYRGTKKILTTTHEKKSVPQHDAYWTVVQ